MADVPSKAMEAADECLRWLGETECGRDAALSAIAAALIAYGKELTKAFAGTETESEKQLRDECDTALARAEAAEGLIAATRRANEAAVDNGLVLGRKLRAAEERVRELESWQARAINLYPELEGLDAKAADKEPPAYCHDCRDVVDMPHDHEAL